MATPERRETKVSGAACDDLELLARGRPVSREAFQSILDDPQAVLKLRRMLKVRDLFAPPDDEESPGPSLARRLPDEEIDLAEVARYLNEGRLDDSDREAAVESLLRERFGDLPPPSKRTAETEIACGPDNETTIDPAAANGRS